MEISEILYVVMFSFVFMGFCLLLLLVLIGVYSLLIFLLIFMKIEFYFLLVGWQRTDYAFPCYVNIV